MNTRKFFQNRCARLLPVFYLTNLLPVLLLIISSAPLALIGWRSDALDDASVPVLNAGLTLFAANSWLAPLYGISGVMPINGVTWTITTMGFFYMVFPCMLPRLKRLQNYESCLSSMYWLQFSLFIICPIIQWVVISPMLCDGTVWNHT
jgi:peptidoglycan/LPS O-acetylase OafA/YrhL